MLLEVKNLRTVYGPKQVPFGLDVAVAEGGTTALLDAIRAGKTTILCARACCVPIGARNTLKIVVFRAFSRDQTIPSERDLL